MRKSWLIALSQRHGNKRKKELKKLLYDSIFRFFSPGLENYHVTLYEVFFSLSLSHSGFELCDYLLRRFWPRHCNKIGHDYYRSRAKNSTEFYNRRSTLLYIVYHILETFLSSTCVAPFAFLRTLNFSAVLVMGCKN